MKVLLGFVATMSLALPFLPACSDSSCSELATYCGDCTSEAYRDSCNSIVANNNATVCADSIATFKTQCPGGTGGGGASASSSSAGGTGGTSSASTTSGSGGSGGASGTGGNGGTGGSGGTSSGGGGAGGS